MPPSIPTSNAAAVNPVGPASINEAAKKENRQIAFQGAAVTSALPAVLAGLVPPSARPAVNFGLMDSLLPAFQQAVTREYSDVPESDFHRGVGNALRYSPKVVFFPLQTMIMDPKSWSGKHAAQFQACWKSICLKSPLTKKLLGNFPVVPTAARIIAQFADAYVGSDLQSKYHQSIANAKVTHTGHAGEFGVRKFFKTLKDEKQYNYLFALPILAYTAHGRRFIVNSLRELCPQNSERMLAIKAEAIAAATLGVTQAILSHVEYSKIRSQAAEENE